MAKKYLDADLLYFTLSLYGDLRACKQDVDSVIGRFDNFLTNLFIPCLQKQFETQLKSFPKAYLNQISFILQQNKDVFGNYLSEHLRFGRYEKESLFIRPEVFEIGRELVENEDKTEMIPKSVYAAYVPLKDGLKKMLERPGFYSQVIKYVNSLKENNDFSNRMHGKLYKTKYECQPNQENKVRLLLDAYSDEFEVRNPLGSHSGEEKMCGITVSLACLPPHLTGKLENILLSVICHAKHLKKFGNEKIFSRTIKDLNDLTENGLDINVDGQHVRVYFDFSLVLGDNLGLNSVCGFSKSFSANYYCRICSASKAECFEMIRENETLVRTVESYEQVLLSGADPAETGIYENCVFNNVTNFHICENMSVDVMHDVFEGICSYTLSKVLQSLIEQKIISLNQINNRISSFSYTKNDVNKPRPIQFSVSKKGKDKLKIRQSAAEMQCLTRYLILMIGDIVPETNENWKLYLYLRRIVGILSCPRLNLSQVFLLQELIQKFNSLYIKLYGKLKPKMHIWLHYLRVILSNGPVVHYSCMKYERKNKQLKECGASTSSNVNLPLTIAIRHQLQQAFISKFCPVPKGDVQFGSVANHEAGRLLKSLIPQFDSKKPVQLLKSVDILGKSFEKSTIIVTAFDSVGPIFGEISRIFLCEDQLYFHVREFKTNYFHKYFHAFNVTTWNAKSKLINVNLLPKLPPCVLTLKQNMELVATRYDL